jgi:hypothetical protein
VSSRLLVVGLFFLLTTSGPAQERSRAIVVRARSHVTTAPLRAIAPISPSGQMSSYLGDSDQELRHIRLQDSLFTFHSDAITSDASPTLSTNAGVNILGIGAGFPGIPLPLSNYVPDTNVAVGPTQFVEFVNDFFAVFNKSNGSLAYGPALGDTLWQSLGGGCSANPNLDEIAQFDKLANVWVMMMPNFYSPASLCIAVSKTSDAVSGGWNLYSFTPPMNTTLCDCEMTTDYPKLAVWPDAYYLSYNQIWNGTYEGSVACALDRAAMLNGGAATMQCFLNTSTSQGVMLPADVDGTNPPPTGSPEYFVNFDSNDQSLDVWQFHVDWTTPANSNWTGPTNIPVAAFTEACGETLPQYNYTTGDCIPQTGTSNTLDSYGDRLMYRLAYRNFPANQSTSPPTASYQALVANHTVEIGTGGTQTGVRWYELQNTGSGFGLYQQGTYAPDSSYRWMGSIAMDKIGDIAMGYSVSSSTMSPSIRYTGRVPSDSLGTMENEVDVLSAAGITPGSRTGSYRWADYSSMAVDPADDCTFWYTTEYMPTTGANWSTRIVSFSFPGCAGAFKLSSASSSLNISAGGQGTVTLTVTPQGGFNAPISFSCPNLPAGITCSFNPPQITPAGSGITTQLTLSAASSAALRRPLVPFLPAMAIMAALCFVGWGTPRKSRLMLLLGSVMVLSGVTISCGGGGGSTTTQPPPVTSTVTVTATAANEQQTLKITVTVD